MSAERVITNTLRLAQADLDAAELLHVGKNRYAVYHCEQAAEKIIKAVLTSEESTPTSSTSSMTW